MITFPADALRRQLEAVFTAWGMPPEPIKTTIDVMLEADLCGIDSHGIAMLPTYDQWRGDAWLGMNPRADIVRSGPVTAVLDGGGGLGHFASSRAMELAIAKCTAFGLAAVGVRNSHHYGAAGVYAAMAAAKGFIGLSFTNVHTPSVVPTFGAEPMFGTNPIAFAAPARRNRPFLLDMATSTVAMGKLTLADLNDRAVPEGWAMDKDARPTLDPKVGLAARMLTPLGATPLMSSHKGYGLAAMVEILCAMLAGGSFAATRAKRNPGMRHANAGHFFMAIDPRAFRGEGEFEDELDDMIDALHGMKRADPDQPVLVHGDPEYRRRAEREVSGIPMPESLIERLGAVAAKAGAAFLLR